MGLNKLEKLVLVTVLVNASRAHIKCMENVLGKYPGAYGKLSIQREWMRRKRIKFKNNFTDISDCRCV